MGNIIPYSISDNDVRTDEDVSSSKKRTTVKNTQDVMYLTVPSIPNPSDKAFVSDNAPVQGLAETMDLRPLIEAPYASNHPSYLKHRANIEIVARQLECMAQSCGAWKGRISRNFWTQVNPRTLASIRDVYDCVKQYGMISYSSETKYESKLTQPAAKISARPYRLLIVKMLPRDVDIWQAFISSQCPIAISLAIYGNQPMSVYEAPNATDVLTMVIPALVIGYDSKRDIFIVQSPFDNEWGEDGYIALPYEYISNPSIVLEMWVAKFSRNMKRFETNTPRTDFDTISFDVTSTADVSKTSPYI